MNQPILCIGAALLDEIYFSQAPLLVDTSNPAQGTTAIGGVMTNVARHLALLDIPVTLITAVGNDAAGNEIITQLNATGIQMDATLRTPVSTGKYIAFHQPDGQLFTAICQDQATIFLTPEYLESKTTHFHQASCIVVDTNLSIECLQWLTQQAAKNNWALIIEPVSVLKAAKLKEIDLNQVALLTPNEEELEAMGGLDLLFHLGVQAVWVRKGSAGSTLHTHAQTYDLGVPSLTICDTTGAGDAALVGWLYAQYHQMTTPVRLEFGHALALHILQQKGAVDTTLNSEQLEQLKHSYYP